MASSRAISPSINALTSPSLVWVFISTDPETLKARSPCPESSNRQSLRFTFFISSTWPLSARRMSARVIRLLPKRALKPASFDETSNTSCLPAWREIKCTVASSMPAGAASAAKLRQSARSSPVIDKSSAASSGTPAPAPQLMGIGLERVASKMLF